MRSETGLIAGPEKPAILVETMGLPLRGSITMPSSVLVTVSPSAPSASHARAMAQMSVTLGESFIYIGLRQRFFTSAHTRAALRASAPKASPPPCTFGQEMLISRMSTSAPSSRAAVSAYSSSEKPEMFASFTPRYTAFSRGNSSAITASTPGFCRPMALSRPQSHSAMRGSGLP